MADKKEWWGACVESNPIRLMHSLIIPLSMLASHSSFFSPQLHLARGDWGAKPIIAMQSAFNRESIQFMFGLDR
jgi:hypothetical protein